MCHPHTLDHTHNLPLPFVASTDKCRPQPAVADGGMLHKALALALRHVRAVQRQVVALHSTAPPYVLWKSCDQICLALHV
mgnify:CR=1 FL=1